MMVSLDLLRSFIDHTRIVIVSKEEKKKKKGKGNADESVIGDYNNTFCTLLLCD